MSTPRQVKKRMPYNSRSDFGVTYGFVLACGVDSKFLSSDRRSCLD
jgi:hypothetical protein